MATFLAHTGVTVFEAEGWCTWATAYIEMEIEAQPDSYYTLALQQAKQMAIDHITQDPKWVLWSLHPATPGNYCLGHGKASTSHKLVRTCDIEVSDGAEAGPSTASRSSSTVHDALPDIALMSYDVDDEDQVSVSYDSNLDNDLKMGPG
jgi:hypothetical protein